MFLETLITGLIKHDFIMGKKNQNNNNRSMFSHTKPKDKKITRHTQWDTKFTLYHHIPQI